MVHPIPIRFDVFTIHAVTILLEDAEQKSNHPDVKIETIVLAEYYTTWIKKLIPYRIKERLPDKGVLIQLPLSIAKILHYRLQHIPSSPANQFLFTRLDNELINRKLKPNFPIMLV